MILRRFMKHVTDQNWFAVSIDLLVLVTGIFLGLQADNWNEQRLNRIEERVYLERLLQDADNTLAEHNVLIASIVQTETERVEFLKVLGSKSFTDQNLPIMSEYYLNSLRFFANLTYYEDTLDELSATGKVSIFRSTDFKNKIARFRSELEKKQKLDELLSGILASNALSLINLIRWNLAGDLIITSLEDLNNNEMIYNYLRANSRAIRDVNSFDLSFNEKTKSFREAIAAELEETK